MKLLELTEQSEIPYPFADKKMTQKDFSRTVRLLKKIYNYLLEFAEVETQPSSVTHLVNGGKDCRIIMYDYKKLLQQKEIYVVVFHGDRRTDVSKAFLKEYTHADWEVVASMQGNDTFLCYASQELFDGNWFNIVLFTESKGKLDVTSKEKHAHAAHRLAPKKFYWVRLHNGILPNGVKEYKGLQLTKTNYYNFDALWFATRTYI